MDERHRIEEAVQFTNSDRGQYILAQALTIAIETMSEVPEIHREVSNIKDMQYILDNLFPAFRDIVKIQRRAK